MHDAYKLRALITAFGSLVPLAGGEDKRSIIFKFN